MSGISADRIVAEYLAQAAAASAVLLPTQREEFLDRLHDQVRERVGIGPRSDETAVTAALAELGTPAGLVQRERERLSRGIEIPIRDGRALSGAPRPTSTLPPEIEATLDPDGLTAAVVRQRCTAELPTERIDRPLFRPEPAASVAPEEVPGLRVRDRLRAMRWELATLLMFVAGPTILGLLALLLGGAMVARSAFWEVRDKVRALLGIPVAGALLVLLRAWAESTQLNELESSSTRLRAAGESVADSMGVAVPVLGLLIACWLGASMARDARWGETARRGGRSSG